MILFSTHCHPEVSEATYRRFLKLPARFPMEGPIAENAAWAREWFAANGRPWVCAIETTIGSSAGCLLIGGEPFGGGPLAARAPRNPRAAVLAVSAGPEAEDESDARWKQDQPDVYFFLQAYASAVVDSLLSEVRSFLGAQLISAPGYRDWPLEESAWLIGFMNKRHPLPGPLRALESGMLVPKKSQLALLSLPADTPPLGELRFPG